MYSVIERIPLISNKQRINGAKPAIPERKPEKAKKHIKRSGKKKKRRSQITYLNQNVFSLVEQVV